MALPSIPLPSKIVVVGGQDVIVTGLSRAQVHLLRGAGDDLALAEAMTLGFATGSSTEDAQEWLGQVPADDAGALLDAVLELSGLAGAGKD